MLSPPKRAWGGHAAAIWYTIIDSFKVNSVNPLNYLTYLLQNVRNKAVELPVPDDFGRLGGGVSAVA
jgi:hypothetical protein